MLRNLLFALALASPIAAQPVDQTPSAAEKDFCGYLKDVEAKTDADCAPGVLADLKSADSAAYSQKLELARKRKADVLKAYGVLKARSVAGKGEASLPQLTPPINERTFPAWLGPESKAIYARWLQAENQRLQQEKSNPISPERKKEIDAAVAANQSRMAALGKLKDASALSCALGESCEPRPAMADPAAPGAMASKGAWTAADYARANAQPGGQRPASEGELDRDVPAPDSIASEVIASAPLGPLAENEKDKNQSPFGKAAVLALAATGGLLLFGGLGGKQLEEKFPNIRRNMGIAAAIGGAVATGAIAWDASAARIAAGAVPLYANQEADEDASEALAATQQGLQRAVQSAPDASSAGIGESAKTGLDFATTKGEARGVISRMDLPEEQARSALSAIRKATASSNFRISEEAGEVVIRTVRSGRNGYQLFEYRIAPTGAKTVIQTAYDAADKLVRYDPK